MALTSEKALEVFYLLAHIHTHATARNAAANQSELICSVRAINSCRIFRQRQGISLNQREFQILYCLLAM